MAIKNRDWKAVWGNSGSMCAFPGCRLHLAESSPPGNKTIILGELAHIVAEEENGPRGHSPLSAEQRNEAFNLILLCPTHHTLIDQDAEKFPVEVLYEYKADHERWVRESLAPPDARNEASAQVYAAVVDLAAESMLSRWEDFTSNLLAPVPRFRKRDVEVVRAFRRKVLTALFGGAHPELEKALVRLSLLLETALTHFLTSAKWDRDENAFFEFRYTCDLLGRWDPPEWEKRHKHDEQVIDRFRELIVEATRAANWVVDATRESINPYFRNDEGRVLAYEDYGLESASIPYEYDEAQKEALRADVTLGLDREKTIMEEYWERQ